MPPQSVTGQSGGKWEDEEGGLFGQWALIDSLPAYNYRYLNQAAPDRSAKEDHWHQLGNDRYTAEAHAGGWVVPYRWEHGLTRLSSNNPAHPSRLAGSGLIRRDDSASTIILNHALLPQGTPWHVTWGEGYAEWSTEIAGLEIKRRVTSPFGDDPILVVDVDIRGEGAGIEYEERWPVELYPITLPAPMTQHSKAPKTHTPFEKIAWNAITGASGALRKVAEVWRGSYAKILEWKHETSPDLLLAIASPRVKHVIPFPEPGRRSWRDLYPQPVFMAVSEESAQQGEHLQKKRHVEAHTDDRGIVFTGHAKFDLTRDNPARLRFIFGWGESAEIPALVEKYKSGELSGWADGAPKIVVAGEGWAEREMSWHGYYLRSMLIKDDYFEGHLLPQASAYGYLHGIHGAPRDYALAAVPMIYLAPDRAKEMILQIMRLMKPSGEMIYGHGGFGMVSSAGGMHASPTDLPIFLMWTIVEYIGATGDMGILDERVPYYPKEDAKYSTARERIELAWYYLRNRVGRGPHGLLRVGSGDWNDPISLMVPNHAAFVKKGESSFNTAFAIHVLLKLADIVQTWDGRSAAQMRSFADALADAMDGAWTGRWYLRGWDGKGGPIGEDRLFLDSNSWCLISGVGGPHRMRTLVKNIGELLDDPSPIGAMILDKPVKVRFGALVPGWDCNGGIWAALNGLLAWGYSLYDPERAWRNLYKQSLAAHSRAYPHIWFGIWSGPDAYNAHYAERPGETFIHPLTPMQEYPIMNSNAHALPLLGLIKIAGFEPVGARLKVDPKLPEWIDSWRINFPLIEARCEENNLKVEYHKMRGYEFPQIAGRQGQW